MKGLQHESIVKGLHKAKQKAERLNQSIVLTIAEEVEHRDPLLFYSFARRKEERFFWHNDLEEEYMSGFGLCKSIEHNGGQKFKGIDEAYKQIQHHIEVVLVDGEERISPVFFGGFSFDKGKSKLWENFADGKFILPTYCYVQRKNRAYVLMNIEVTPETTHHEVIESFNWILDKCTQPHRVMMHKPEIQKIQPCDQEKWIEAVKTMIHKIKERDLEKVVAAREMLVQATYHYDSIYLLRQLQQQQPNCFIFAIEQGGDCFIGATPERLVKVEKDELQTMALAGTTKRGQLPLEDEQLKRELLMDEKNGEEHDIVVKMIVNELEDIATEIQFKKRPGLLNTRHLHHLYTPITGKVKEDARIFDILEVLHPTPALGGFPKEKAKETIRQLEPMDRGWYGAPIGWIDGNGNGDFAVGIRSALLKEQTAHLFAGCGIVRESNPMHEFEETTLKFTPMLTAIKGE